MSRTRLATLVASLACVLLIGSVGTASAQTATPKFAKTVAVTGAAKNGKKLKNGTFTFDRFTKRNGKLLAVGTLKGTFKGKSIKRQVTMPVSRPTNGAAAAQITPDPNACTILNLDIPPITLNLLGLRVRTDRIHLIIDAVPGPGNLLGNLLCGITGILNPGQLANTPLGQLTQILNALLALSPRTA
jgi:hypothetical protein